MRRAPPKFDISIAGDEQEQSRIQLEKNLLHTDLSLHLSSTHDDYSVENPRHHSGVSAPFSAFGSIDRSREPFDTDEGLSQLHAWSYRTGEDDEGIHPFAGGETLSTAAHHASALTLSAGLGGRGARRDISLSGAEYDPERPLQDLVAGIDSKFSLLDVEDRHSRNAQANSVPFDPLVVDSAAELDQVLSAQHARAAARRLRSPQSEQSTSSSSSEPDTPDHTSSKPKFSDGLSHLTFSPKRPRSPALVSCSASPVHPNPSSRRRSSDQNKRPDAHRTTQASTRSSLRAVRPEVVEGEPTPRPRKVHLQTQVFPSQYDPNGALPPPTPSTGNSKFTRLARGLAREIEAEQSRWHAPVDIDPYANGGEEDLLPTTIRVNTFAGSSKKINKQVHLPDVTGLTSAVESPAKGHSHHAYEDRGYGYEDGEGQARLQMAMNLLQQKIAHLDAENHTSKKRMGELEHELDLCRQDVARQRDLVIQREELLQRQNHIQPITAKMKGKARVVEDTKEDQKRYKQAVEEKKALEALIATLRSHMTRLTSELASHQVLLDELRSLREADKHTLQQKVREVDLLRREVEKVAGEVEVLKGIAEEGLRERRERSLSYASEGPQSAELGEANKDDDVDSEAGERGVHGQDGVQEDAEDPDIEDIQVALARQALHDRTMRTDHATLGSTPFAGAGDHTRRYVEDSEVERISAELEERRSERSRSSSRLGSSLSSNGSRRAPSVASSIGSFRHPRPAESHPKRSVTPDGTRFPRPRAPNATSAPTSQDVRPTAPTPAHATRYPHPVDADAPFPQIRGARLERMFFSAPEHNARTCTVCHRRGHREAAQQRPLWYPASRGRNVTVADASDEDEGFGEGSVSGEGQLHQQAGVNLDFLSKEARHDKLPPQTVLVRVLRELEDDFTHYKGIYTELADQYKDMDAASNVVKRNVLAQHLREVIDILEQRGDQIASLYDLLTFEDKPAAQSVVSGKDNPHHRPIASKRTHDSRKRLAFA
ncbi:hypothetical protein BC834DRAFT_596013 [Gloeopeniophorella convolvens]|nr:hypothetical protein BC834DRAFT_596013 [Gloeopeniophorella convolvens]